MDFIERWFGISPDGGSGLLEALYVFAVVNTIMIAAAYWARRRGRSAWSARRVTSSSSRGRRRPGVNPRT
jgi:hypothetical protein